MLIHFYIKLLLSYHNAINNNYINTKRILYELNNYSVLYNLHIL